MRPRIGGVGDRARLVQNLAPAGGLTGAGTIAVADEQRSLPLGSGIVLSHALAPSEPTPLLAEIGDARGRFPTNEALAAAAGISSSTRASGRSGYVAFRRGCNHRLRKALVDFVDGSRQANPGPSTATPAPELAA